MKEVTAHDSPVNRADKGALNFRKEFYYFSSDNYFYYNRLYGIIRFLFILDILVLLIALLLEKKQYSKKTFYLYLVYVFLLVATAFLDYIMDTWYLQNLMIFFSSMIISIDHMTQVSDQWLETKKELLFSEYRASHDIMTGLWNKASGIDKVGNCLENMSESDVEALGFVDIDNFKSVNDTYGHEIGDFWICEIAAEREQNVHCSIGIYQVKGAGKKLHECVIIADGLLYQAKKNGRDTYVIE